MLQVPQYLLEHACASGGGSKCNVVVTQPRRIAAIALAERVATERDGSSAGGAVGYAVRLESKQSDRTRLLFCTTGVLLSKLRDDPELREVSHVVVDEARRPPQLAAHPPCARDVAARIALLVARFTFESPCVLCARTTSTRANAIKPWTSPPPPTLVGARAFVGLRLPAHRAA